MKWLWLLALSGCTGFSPRPPPLFTVVAQDPPERGTFFNAVWGSSKSDVFAVGVNANLSHYDGHLWTTVGGLPSSQDLTAVWGRGPGDVWVTASASTADAGYFLHFDGVNWTQVGSELPVGVDALWGTGGDIWAGGVRGALYRKQGDGDFEAQPSLPVNPLVSFDLYSPAIESFAGTGPSSVLATGGMLALYYFDGGSWSPIFRPDDGHFFHTDVVAGSTFLTGGNQYAISRFTPPDKVELLHEEDVNSFNLRGSWASDANHAIFVGEVGKVLVWDGSQVRSVPSGLTYDLLAVWGVDPDDVWIVGAAGTILRAQHLF